MGAQTSDPEIVRKKPQDAVSENQSIRSREPLEKRGINRRNNQSNGFPSTNQMDDSFIDHPNLSSKYDPNADLRDCNRRGNLQTMVGGMAAVGKTTESTRTNSTAQSNRICKTSKNN